MSYKSIFTRSFTKEFDKPPRDVKERILEALEKVAETPYAWTSCEEDWKDYGDGERANTV